jgi:hypothetical protein
LHSLALLLVLKVGAVVQAAGSARMRLSALR